MAKLQLMGGSVYLEEYAPDGSLGDKFYPGTTDLVSFNTDLETIEHNDTEEEVQVLDGEDVTKRNVGIAFQTADINDTFNKMAYLSSDTALTQTAQTATAVVIASALAGKVEDIGYMDITTLVVKDVLDTTTYVLGTDYTYDRKWGTLIVLSTGSITDADEIHLTVDANAITDGKSLTSFAEDKREYRMTYQGRSSKGRNEKHIFEKVSIAMEGDRTLKAGGDSAYSLISFSGAALKHNGLTHRMETF